MADYLLTINSVREKSAPVFKLALSDELNNFDSHFNDESRLDECLDFIIGLIKRDFGTNFQSIPPHGRLQHLEAGDNKPRVKQLVAQWVKGEKLDNLEITRRLIDLFVVSVFLDAGAGNVWKYKEPGTDDYYNRSEGLAVASYHIFAGGEFSNKGASEPYEVNAAKLESVTEDKFKDWLQVTAENPLAGFDGRLELLQSLNKALLSNGKIFGGPSYYSKQGYDKANNRPGNIVDYLIHLPTTEKDESPAGDGGYVVDLTNLWDGLMEGFNSIWKSRLELDGKSLGDAWYCESAKKIALKSKYAGDASQLQESDKIVPFHKLTQWLAYSLLIPLKQYGNFSVKREGLLTGLPEYRNGGLLLDFGLLSIKPDVYAKGVGLTEKLRHRKNDNAVKEQGAETIPTYKPDDDLIVEWRCCTVGFLDYILPIINGRLGVKGTDQELQLPQLIEAGSWKAGREIAAKKRPDTKGPPINLDSDGTVF